MFRLSSARRVTTPGEAAWRGRARGRVEQQPQQRALCVSQQERTRQSQQQRRVSGGVAVVPRSSSLLLVLPGRRTARRHTLPARFRQCGPIRISGFVRRGEGRRTAPGSSGPRARRKAGATRGIARAGRIQKPGTARHSRPPRPAPLPVHVPSSLLTPPMGARVPAQRMGHHGSTPVASV